MFDPEPHYVQIIYPMFPTDKKKKEKKRIVFFLLDEHGLDKN
jgi:hypothetical protein